ncbi:MAG TPA: hypothetical protein DGO89_16970, partial [Microcoleaceae bacterium UBA9251]|nr:hypothetical protein [Microcoleaceae cyanobacterium UBA9251]
LSFPLTELFYEIIQRVERAIGRSAKEFSLTQSSRSPRITQTTTVTFSSTFKYFQFTPAKLCLVGLFCN